MPEPEQAPEQTPEPVEPPGDRPVTGRDRLREAFRRPGRGQAVVAVLLAVVGFAAVTQVNATEEDDSYAGYRQQDLIDVLSGQAGAAERARAEIARLEEQRRDLLGRSDRRQAALDQARDEADALNVLAGLVPVTGPGVRIEVGANGVPPTIDVVLDLVQELRSAGAEAIEVAGDGGDGGDGADTAGQAVRLVAQSSFEATDAGLLVDGTLLQAPYVVDAIGEPSTLGGALSFPGGPQATAEEDGSSLTVEELDELDIDSVVADPDPDFAVPEGS